MDVAQAAQQVVHDRLDMVLCQLRLLKHHREQVSALSLKHIIKVLESFWLASRLQHIVKFYHISVATHLSQNLDFPEQALGIYRVVEDLGDLLDGDIFVCRQMLGLHDRAVTTLAYLALKHVVLADGVLLLKVLLGDHIILGFILEVLIVWALGQRRLVLGINHIVRQ